MISSNKPPHISSRIEHLSSLQSNKYDLIGQLTNANGKIRIFLQNSTSVNDLQARKQALLNVLEHVQNEVNSSPLHKLKTVMFPKLFQPLELLLIQDNKLLEILQKLAQHDRMPLVATKLSFGLGACYTRHMQALVTAISDYQITSHLIEQYIGNGQEVTTYPSDQHCQANDFLPRKFTLKPEYAYLMFIDRNYKKYFGKGFCPSIFDNDHSDLTPGGESYVKSAFMAYRYLESISFEELAFEHLENAIRFMVAVPEYDGLYSISPVRTEAPYGTCTAYYLGSTITESCIRLKKINFPNQLLLNQYCASIFNTLSNGDHEVYILPQYPNLEEIKSCLAKYKQLYLNNIAQSSTDEDIIATILLFTSQIECSHFFTNGNNRLTMQILLNKLLVDNGLKPSILYVPNGMSGFVIYLLTKHLNRIKEPYIPALPQLTEILSKAIAWVEEGQRFCSQCIVAKTIY